MEACYGGTDVMERSCAVARGKDTNMTIHYTMHISYQGRALWGKLVKTAVSPKLAPRNYVWNLEKIVELPAPPPHMRVQSGAASLENHGFRASGHFRRVLGP